MGGGGIEKEVKNLNFHIVKRVTPRRLLKVVRIVGKVQFTQTNSCKI